MLLQKIVGSHAAAHRVADWYRKPLDLDIWSSGHLGPSKGIDICMMPQEIIDAFESKDDYASLNDLLTIKVSHLPWPIMWLKHANDALFLKSKGATLNMALYELLKEYWKIEHGTKTQLSLYKTSNEFFNDSVVKLYNHDFLHTLVSYPNAPIYTTVLKEGHQVFTDVKKWEALSFDNKIKMMKEEIAVICCERWYLHDTIRNKLTFAQCWRFSVEKTITALTKGRYSEFMVENLEHFILADRKMVGHLMKTLKGLEL